jgi:hypothetical protein
VDVFDEQGTGGDCPERGLFLHVPIPQIKLISIRVSHEKPIACLALDVYGQTAASI